MASRASNQQDEARNVPRTSSYFQVLNKTSEVEKESLEVLKQIQQQLRMDIERIDRVSIR